LYQEGAIAASIFDVKRLAVKTTQEQLNEAHASLTRIIKTGMEQTKEAEANLERIAEVRPTDVQLAQAEIDSAILAVKRTQAELDLTYVRSPIDGQVLKINAMPGEAFKKAVLSNWVKQMKCTQLQRFMKLT
jgi:HlyD family secretion protein